MASSILIGVIIGIVLGILIPLVAMSGDRNW